MPHAVIRFGALLMFPRNLINALYTFEVPFFKGQNRIHACSIPPSPLYTSVNNSPKHHIGIIIITHFLSTVGVVNSTWIVIGCVMIIFHTLKPRSTQESVFNTAGAMKTCKTRTRMNKLVHVSVRVKLRFCASLGPMTHPLYS